ncbi:hypothetical protein MJ8_24160 [Mesorhizobium sp. J8]|nr:hypothetical protein MJ8_24160 [Mesorhizobium sp. J8]
MNATQRRSARPSSLRKTAAFLHCLLDEKLGVLRPFRFHDIVLTNRLPERFPQRLELKDRQPLISFFLVCAGVHNAKTRKVLARYICGGCSAHQQLGLTSFGCKSYRDPSGLCRDGAADGTRSSERAGRYIWNHNEGTDDGETADICRHRPPCSAVSAEAYVLLVWTSGLIGDCLCIAEPQEMIQIQVATRPRLPRRQGWRGLLPSGSMSPPAANRGARRCGPANRPPLTFPMGTDQGRCRNCLPSPILSRTGG